MKKSGELTSSQIITITLAIVGFVIVVGFILLQLDIGGYTEDELCRLSVLTRATSPEKAKSALPLQCTTKKICLTSVGGKCDDSFAGEEDVEVISLPSDDDDAKRKIEEVSANAMYDCWSMMGEGRLDLFGTFLGDLGLNVEEQVCVICSRVALDLKDEHKDIEIDLQKYMGDNLAPGSQYNYIEIFTHGGADAYPYISDVAFEEKLNAVEKEKDKDDNEIEMGEINKGELAFVFSQIKPESYSQSLQNMGEAGLVLSGATFMTPGVGKIAKVLIFNKVGLTVAAVAAAVGVGVNVYNTYQEQNAAVGYCGGLSSNKGDGEEGCSMVQAVPYTVKGVNLICPQIQGNT